MTTHATFARLAHSLCKFSKASHIFLKMAFGKCLGVWRVLAKVLGKSWQVWQVLAKVLGKCRQVWQVLAMMLGASAYDKIGHVMYK